MTELSSNLDLVKCMSQFQYNKETAVKHKVKHTITLILAKYTIPYFYC